MKQSSIENTPELDGINDTFPNCGHWNKVSVNKIFLEQPNPIEPKVKVVIPMYEPLETSKCEKCGKTIAEPKELIRIVKGEKDE